MSQDFNHFPKQLIRRIFVCLLILSAVCVTACSKSPFADLEPLPANQYLKKPGNFLGNTYLLSAQIDSQIEWEEGVGRILAVKTEGSTSRLPVFVPDSAGRNLNVGQRYKMQVSIRKGGLIYVEDLHKF